MNDHLRKACESFIAILSDDELESDELFLILNEVAEKRNFCIAALQRGISGTFVHFRKLE